MSVLLYVEGGGNRAELKSQCRKGFHDLLTRAGFAGRLPRVVACGPRNAAFDRFETALGGARDYPVLLVDSEGPVASPNQPHNPSGAWRHLDSQDGWQRPKVARDDQAQLMVTCMETWLVADRTELASHFPGMNQNALPSGVRLESRRKEDVSAALGNATSPSPKGRYDKRRDSFDLLGRVDPVDLKRELPHFRRSSTRWMRTSDVSSHNPHPRRPPVPPPRMGAHCDTIHRTCPSAFS